MFEEGVLVRIKEVLPLADQRGNPVEVLEVLTIKPK